MSVNKKEIKNLKTMKDIENGLFLSASAECLADDLRAAAKEWLEFFKKHPMEFNFSKETMSDFHLQLVTIGCECMLKHFFNLEEE